MLKILLMDAQTNLSNVENQAEINLINLYSEIPDILQSAFLNADNALNSQTSMMTKDENGQYPQLTFTVTDYQTQLDAASKRADAQDALDKFESELMNLPTEISEWDSQLNYSIDELTIVRTFFESASRCTWTFNLRLNNFGNLSGQCEFCLD